MSQENIYIFPELFNNYTKFYTKQSLVFFYKRTFTFIITKSHKSAVRFNVAAEGSSV